MGHLCDRLGHNEPESRCNLFSKPLSSQQVSKQHLALQPIFQVSSLTSLVVLVILVELLFLVLALELVFEQESVLVL